MEVAEIDAENTKIFQNGTAAHTKHERNIEATADVSVEATINVKSSSGSGKKMLKKDDSADSADGEKVLKQISIEKSKNGVDEEERAQDSEDNEDDDESDKIESREDEKEDEESKLIVNRKEAAQPDESAGKSNNHQQQQQQQQQQNGSDKNGVKETPLSVKSNEQQQSNIKLNTIITTTPPTPTEKVPPISTETDISNSTTQDQQQHLQQRQQQRQDFVNSTLKEIISDIDRDIEQEKQNQKYEEQQLELIKQQQILAEQIKQQQLLAEQFVAHNQLLQKQQQQYIQLPHIWKSSTTEESQTENGFIRKQESIEESSTKRINLQKIFTPATDAEEILPKNRKLYASSAFYTPGLHPTVEDQVELARRISHSLSDISNQQSKGQTMYVNRKKRSVKWVHEGSGQDNHQYKPPTSPSVLPAYSDVGINRVQLNMHQDRIQEKYIKPSLQIVKTPWDEALENVSASGAFKEISKSYSPDVMGGGRSPISTSAPVLIYNSNQKSSEYNCQQKLKQKDFKPATYNSQRDLAYKPSIPQGWKAPSVNLPKELYVPKEIPLGSYAPPPLTSKYLVNDAGDNRNPTYHQQQKMQTTTVYSSPLPEQFNDKFNDNYNKFPLSKPNCTAYSFAQPPKQQIFAPNSYQKVNQTTNQPIPVSFNPSPLPYEKLAKFEVPPEQPISAAYYYRPTSKASQHLCDDNSSFEPSQQSKYYNSYGLKALSQPFPASNSVNNYNSLARGWDGEKVRSSTGNYKTGYQSSRPPIPLITKQVVDLPYTDF